MICILCNKLSFRLGVPSLLLFILLGMVFGSDGLFRIPFENYAFAEKLCAVVIIAGRISDSGADRCVLSLGDRDGMAGKLFDRRGDQLHRRGFDVFHSAKQKAGA